MTFDFALLDARNNGSWAIDNLVVDGVVLSPVTANCFGDGSRTPCPCANTGSAGRGCGNSVQSAGAHLATTGTNSIVSDTLVLSATGVPNGPGLYFQGTTQSNGGNGITFGDGLRCVGGSIVRLGVVGATGNASTYPTGVTPPNSVPVSTKGLVTAGDVRNYQLWYRDSDVSGRTASVFDFTNGVRVTRQRLTCTNEGTPLPPLPRGAGFRRKTGRLAKSTDRPE